jgi:thioredoxin 1
VCRDYASRFDEVKARFPEAVFLWVDVEDEADMLHPLEVENFPTLLVACGDSPRFFGPLPPQAQTLERLVRAHSGAEGQAQPSDPSLVGVLRRIQAAHFLR